MEISLWTVWVKSIQACIVVVVAMKIEVVVAMPIALYDVKSLASAILVAKLDTELMNVTQRKEGVKK